MELAIVTQPDINNPVAGDLYLDPLGHTRLVTKLSEEVAQRLFVRFQFFKGEWFLNLDEGTPYYQLIMVKNPPDAIVRAVFGQVIEGCDGVEALRTLTYTVNRQRHMTLKFTALLEDGSIFNSSDFAPFVVRV